MSNECSFEQIESELAEAERVNAVETAGLKNLCGERRVDRVLA